MARSQRFAEALRVGLFGSFLVLQRKPVSYGWLTIIGQAIKFLQLLVFPLQTSLGFPTNASETTTRPLREVASSPSIVHWIQSSDPQTTLTTFIVLLYLTYAWVGVYILLQAWALYNFSKGEIPVIWPLRLLRAVANISASVAFIPLFNMLVRPLACGSEYDPVGWQQNQYNCFSGSHLAHCIISTLLAAMLTMLCVVFTLFFFESHILSSNLSAKVSGRVEAGFICMKCILVLLSEILAYHIGQGATSILIFFCGCSWILSVWYCMPFVHHGMNRGQLAGACSFSFASVCLMIGLVYPMYDAGITLYLGIPLSAIGGIWLADIRRSSLMRKSPLQMTSAYEAELKVRYILQGAIYETLHPKSVQPRLQAEWQDPLSASGPEMGVQLPAESRRSTVTSLPGNVAPAQTVVNDEWIATYRQVDAEARAAMLRHALPRTLIEQLEQQFRDSVVRMPRSSLLHIFIARFYSTFADNRHMQVSHLIQAQRLFPWLDVAFLAFQGKRHAEASAGQHATSALNRVAFERHLTEARRHTASAVAAQAAFWAELLNSKPSVDVLNKIASSVSRASRAAELAFQGLFAVNPQSVIALRLHAQYNQMVCNNQEKAGTIAAEADRLEDHAAKQEHGALYGISQSFGLQFFRQTSIDVQSDSTGVVNIGGTTRDLGLIFECNAALCRMFGYSRIQLERRNISVLLPSPFADMHDGFLRKFISTGEGRIVANTILVFGKHRLGYIFPIALNVRGGEQDENNSSFVGLIRFLNTPDHYILLDASLSITGCDQLSMRLLNIEMADIDHQHHNIANFVHDWDAVQDTLRGPRGGLVTVRPAVVPASAYSSPKPRGSRTARSSLHFEVSEQTICAQLQTSQFGSAAAIHTLVWRFNDFSHTVGSFHKFDPNAPRTLSDYDLGFKVSTHAGLQPSSSMEPQHHSPPADNTQTALMSPETLESSFSIHSRERLPLIKLPTSPGERFVMEHSLTPPPPPPPLPIEQNSATKTAAEASPIGINTDANSAEAEHLEAVVATMQSGWAPPSLRRGRTGDASSQKSSRSLGMKTMRRLRQTLDNLQRAGLILLGLQRLRLIAILTLIVNAVLVIFSTWIVIDSAEFVRKQAIYSSHADSLIQAMLFSNVITTELMLGVRGWDRSTFANHSAIASDLADVASKMSEATTRIYDLIKGTQQQIYFLDEYYEAFYLLPGDVFGSTAELQQRRDITGNAQVVLTIDGQALLLTPKPTSLYRQLLEHAAAVARISVLPLQEFTNNNQDVAFVLYNSGSEMPFHEKVNDLLLEALTATNAAASTLMGAALWVFVGIAISVTTISLAMTVPTVYTLVSERDSILSSFAELPYQALVILHRLSVTRWKSVMRQESVVQGDDGVTDSSEDEGAATGLHTGLGAAEVTGIENNSDDDDDKWERLFRKELSVDVLAAPQRHSRKLKHKKFNSYVQLVGKFTQPSHCVSLFYGLMFVIAYTFQSKINNIYKVSVTAANRASKLPELLATVNGALMRTDNNEHQVKMAVAIMSSFERDYQTLLYHPSADSLPTVPYVLAEQSRILQFEGSESNSFKELSDEHNAHVKAVMLGDACDLLPSLWQAYLPSYRMPSYTECIAYQNGMLTHGVNSGYLPFLQDVQAVLLRRAQAANFNITSGEGTIAANAILSLDHFRFPFNLTVQSGETTLYSLTAEYASSAFLRFREYSSRYLHPLLSGLQQLYRATTISLIDSFRVSIVTYNAVCTIVFVAVMTLVFIPGIRKIDDDVQAKRAMLLLLPPEAVVYVPAIRKAIRDITNHANPANSSRSSRRILPENSPTQYSEDERTVSEAAREPRDN